MSATIPFQLELPQLREAPTVPPAFESEVEHVDYFKELSEAELVKAGSLL